MLMYNAATRASGEVTRSTAMAKPWPLMAGRSTRVDSCEANARGKPSCFLWFVMLALYVVDILDNHATVSPDVA